MKLYEVISFPADFFKDNALGKSDILLPTGESFESKALFLTHASKNGEKYDGKKFKLLSEANESGVLTINKRTEYDVVEAVTPAQETLTFPSVALSPELAGAVE
jgi:hypothetical protein